MRVGMGDGGDRHRISLVSESDRCLTKGCTRSEASGRSSGSRMPALQRERSAGVGRRVHVLGAWSHCGH